MGIISLWGSGLSKKMFLCSFFAGPKNEPKKTFTVEGIFNSAKAPLKPFQKS
jgi:hypothetical protein